MQSAICLLSVVPVRSEPSHRSEMVSQLLFGEYVTMGEEKDDFIAVKCLYDGYEGWVQTNQLTPVRDEQILSSTEFIGVFCENVFIDGRCRMIPFATPVFKSKLSVEPLCFGKRQVTYNILEVAIWKVTEKNFSEAALQKITSLYLDTPYLWGGKSVYGTDCSGFVQQVFKLFGVKLLRDAYLQASQGHPVGSLEEARLSDLVFFQNEKGSVTHVGILLRDNKIVHASGKVRIDSIDSNGILNRETGNYSHRLHSIRRFPL